MLLYGDGTTQVDKLTIKQYFELLHYIVAHPQSPVRFVSRSNL